MKILVATDGSEFSDAAVERVCRLITDAENTEVRIVSAYEQPVMAAAAPYAIPAGYNPVLEKELHENASDAARSAEQQIGERLPAVQSHLSTAVLCGAPAQAIIHEAEDWGADLIVVGSHGYGFWERMFLGSVSNAVVHHAPCSVLVVRRKPSQHDKN